MTNNTTYWFRQMADGKVISKVAIVFNKTLTKKEIGLLDDSACIVVSKEEFE